MEPKINDHYLGLSSAATFLCISQLTLHRWVEQGKIPCRRQGESFFFSKPHLVAWAKEHDMPLSETEKKHSNSGQCLPDLMQALKAGGQDRLTALGIDGLFSEMVDKIDFPAHVNRLDLVAALLERERIVSTAVGRGIAFPHPRQPEKFAFQRSRVALFYLDPPISLNAQDGEPIFAFFSIFAPDTRSHLRLLSGLSHFLHQVNVYECLQRRCSLEELLVLCR